jgi:hypothetical protein
VIDFDKAKISDYELRNFAEYGETSELRSVIVEVDVPPRAIPRSEWQKTPWKKGSSPRSTDYPLLNEERVIKNDEQLMNQLEEKLMSLNLLEKPVRLDIAQAFVINVTPEQLRVISRFPLAGLIRPNRVHHISRY